MLYFSVVTITTLSFGDIIPLTYLARSLVTLEAFLGPLLLAFFLSAIGLRLAPR
jgi:voltage-gated potassium channel